MSIDNCICLTYEGYSLEIMDILIKKAFKLIRIEADINMIRDIFEVEKTWNQSIKKRNNLIKGGKKMDLSDFYGLIAAMAGVFMISAVVILILYLISAFARYKYLKIRSYENAWMAFIPIVNIWVIVEATYGKCDRINIYGWDAPAMVLKLWPVVAYALALVINVIPLIGNILSLLLYILEVAVLAMIFKDMMEHLDKPQEMVTAVIAVIFHIVSDIMILSATGSFQPGQQDWQTDNRVLNSQTAIDGPLSFLNGKIWGKI